MIVVFSLGFALLVEALGMAMIGGAYVLNQWSIFVFKYDFIGELICEKKQK